MERQETAPDTALKDRLLSTVQQVMQVRDVTLGGAPVNYVARFRGRLAIDSLEAFERLRNAFQLEGLTPMLREEGDDHVVLAVRELSRPGASNPWINLVLFLVTLLSVLLAGTLYGFEGPVPEGSGLLLALLQVLPRGIPFAASILAILVAHEFGHYLAARFHRTEVTLPYFLPFPGSVFGTFGAFIRMKEPPRNRRILLDIGLAGPLAGLAVAIPVLLLGLSLSEVEPLPSRIGESLGLTLEGNSLLYLAAKYVVKGDLLPSPPDYGGLSPLLYWLRYFFLGMPAPFGGRDVLLHPVAWAGWAGLLVTSLNLMPVGQLDGGHLIYVLLGRQAARLWPAIVVALVAFGLVWQGWWLWAILIYFLGRTNAQPLDEITPLDDRRKALAIFGLIVFLLTFTPVPLRSFVGG